MIKISVWIKKKKNSCLILYETDLERIIVDGKQSFYQALKLWLREHMIQRI